MKIVSQFISRRSENKSNDSYLNINKNTDREYAIMYVYVRKASLKQTERKQQIWMQSKNLLQDTCTSCRGCFSFVEIENWANEVTWREAKRRETKRNEKKKRSKADDLRDRAPQHDQSQFQFIFILSSLIFISFACI